VTSGVQPCHCGSISRQRPSDVVTRPRGHGVDQPARGRCRRRTRRAPAPESLCAGQRGTRHRRVRQHPTTRSAAAGPHRAPARPCHQQPRTWRPSNGVDLRPSAGGQPFSAKCAPLEVEHSCELALAKRGRVPGRAINRAGRNRMVTGSGCPLRCIALIESDTSFPSQRRRSTSGSHSRLGILAFRVEFAFL